MTLSERMNPNNGPKKLLALDGGGIRGLITIEVLAKIESLLRQRSGRASLVLADYFDYIAGTSTGAVIGTLLSLGKSVDEIRTIYRDFAKIVFNKDDAPSRPEAEIAINIGLNLLFKKFNRRTVAYSQYSAEPLSRKLQEIIGGDDVTLCNNPLKTLLLIVMSNATTDSVWPVCNNPKAKYNDPNRQTSNANIALWRLARASTAAPVVFPAEEIEVGTKQAHVFVDGGVTPYNNPAFQLFLQATLQPYNLGWKTGEKQMLLVSIGTGLNPVEKQDLKAADLDFKRVLMTAMEAQFNSAIYQQDLLCRAFGKCLFGANLDSEVGNMIDVPAPGGDKLFTYLRYNAKLSRSGLDELDQAGELANIDPANISKLDSIDYMDDLKRVGNALAQHVSAQHFAAFDPS